MISGLVLAEIANALDINLDMKRTIGYVQFQYKSGAYCVSPAIVSYPDPNVRNDDYRLQYNITR